MAKMPNNTPKQLAEITNVTGVVANVTSASPVTNVSEATATVTGIAGVAGILVTHSQSAHSSHAFSNMLPTNPGDWDPVTNSDWQKETPSPQCILRIKRDIMSIYNEPPPGLFVVPDEKDMTVIHALITGTFDTPYEGGFFYFFIRCPPDYPIRPPRVKLMTTGAGTVRFNPNMYKNGKICLSILGTWTGPCWSPAQSLSSLLISIQSLLNEKPYHNEPGFERERNPGDTARYNDIIQHETLRVAVCGMLENETCLNIPEPLQEVMEKTFLEFYDYYVTTAQKKSHLNGQAMLDPFANLQDPYCEERGIYQYNAILARLRALRKKLSDKLSSPRGQGDKPSDNECSTSDSDAEVPS
ncbi:hypothetical protein R5R35_001248 [Gryllus longicercus]|uniref:Ubiquitin-conjugating enzyme E2 Z n=1 Tax=Gryllus longicercus TaxID=2509291 RepID=A0AAN9VK47_9ORTH|nr:Ubiquitin-conjugating enzyme E2 N [Gryllus bimaculatus]